MADIIVNDTAPRVQYTASGGQTDFTYSFPIFADADLKVYLTPTGNTADDTTDILTLTTDYTVSGAGTTAGGTVTLVSAATAGDIVTIVRDSAIERTTDYNTGGDLVAGTLNDEQDLITMLLLQNESRISRCLRLAETNSASVDMALALATAGEILRINAAGDGVETIAISTLGDLVATTAFTETLLDDSDAATFLTTLGITSFIQTLLDDTDAATARTTLGAQTLDATLTALAGVTTAADKMIYATASDTFTTTDLTSFARTLLDDTTAAAVLTTLGVTSFIQTLLDDADAATAQVTLGIDNRIAQALVNFNGTGTVTIRDSYNVSSITDNGTGDYTVNFSTAMPDANYTVSGVPRRNATNNDFNMAMDQATAPTTTAVRIATTPCSAYALEDALQVNVVINGN